jgi:DNA replication initiation complex subunit (GINS family)
MRDRRPQQQVTDHAIRRVERVLRKAQRAKDKRANKANAVEEAASKEPLTEWESEFLGSLKQRLQTFGSAFKDPNLGAEEEALSIMQNAKLYEVSRSVRRKVRNAKSAASTEGGEEPDRPDRKEARPIKRKGLARGKGLQRKTPLNRGGRGGRGGRKPKIIGSPDGEE